MIEAVILDDISEKRMRANLSLKKQRAHTLALNWILIVSQFGWLFVSLIIDQSEGLFF